MCRTWPIALVLMLLACGNLSAQRRGAAPRAVAANDGLDQLAINAVDAAKLDDLASSMKNQLKPLLVNFKAENLDRITRLATFREFGRYFGQIGKLSPDQAETLEWLAGKPQLLSTLCLAVSQSDDPQAVLGLLSLLRSEPDNHLEQFPDLATALCIVWDQPASQAHGVIRVEPRFKNSSTTVPMLMHYYVNARPQLRFDPADLPWQLSVYLVDNLAGPDEIAWAAEHYAGRKAIGNVFFDVPYDTQALEGALLKLVLEKKSYTLPNILQTGGLCGDQAYFAAQVARSLGVPATIVTGKTSEAGEGHAWVGYLDVQAGRAVWDFDEGRYAVYQFWKGDVIDPQTREPITDADVSLTAELQNSSPHDRLASEALCQAADVLDPAQQAELYMQAITLAPGNRQAWMELSALAMQLRLDAKQTVALRAAVTKFALKPYPDFAFAILRRSIAGRGTIQQIDALNEMRSLFPNRPDLAAEIGLDIGDLQLAGQQPEQALASYGDVIQRNTAIGAVVLEAMQCVDKLLRDTGHLPELARAYGLVWQRMPQPEATVIVRATPFYRIGELYEKLLDDLGDKTSAQEVHARLDALTHNMAAMHDQN